MENKTVLANVGGFTPVIDTIVFYGELPFLGEDRHEAR
jgi:hypothetical protein